MSAFTFGDPGIGGGDPIFGNVTFGAGGVFGTPSPVPSNSGGGPSNPSGSWLSQLLPWANLGAQTFLADQAITSPRPSTITYLPNGQLAVSGGGAATPSTGLGLAVGAIPSWIWIVIALVTVILVLKK